MLRGVVVTVSLMLWIVVVPLIVVVRHLYTLCGSEEREERERMGNCAKLSEILQSRRVETMGRKVGRSV